MTLKVVNDTCWRSAKIIVKSVLKDINKFDRFIISIVNDSKNIAVIRSKCKGLLPTREDYVKLQYLDTLLDRFGVL